MGTCRYAKGPEIERESAANNIEELRKDAGRSNSLLAGGLQSGPFEQEFHELVLRDAAEGWMSKPIPFTEATFQARAVPGMGVHPGFKKDRSVKVRAVCNFSWCTPWLLDGHKRSSYKEAKSRSVNGCTWLPERFSHDHLIS